MSATSQSIRFKFGDFCRQVFQRPARRGASTPTALTPDEEALLAPHGQAIAQGVTIPLQVVLAAFPPELRSKILAVDTRNLSLIVPFEKVIPELSRGSVKITFGEIRRAMHQVFVPGLESDAAQVVLPLNEILSRLDPAWLARRPSQKKPVVLPEEISSPFAGRGQGLTLGVGNSMPAPRAGGPAEETMLTRKRELPMASAASFTPVSPRGINGSGTPAPTLAIPRSEPISFKLPDAGDRPEFVRKPAKPALDAAPLTPASPLGINAPGTPAPTMAMPRGEPISFKLPDAGDRPESVRKPAKPALDAAPLTPASPLGINALGTPAPTMAMPRGEPIPFKLPDAGDRPESVRKPALDAAPTSPLPPRPLTPPPSWPPELKDYLAAPPVARAMQPARPATVMPSPADAAVLLAPLTVLAGAWPDALQMEIRQLNLMGARVAMPLEFIEASLKRGRVILPWKTLRSWIVPAAPPSHSPHDTTELELPLSVVAPLFLARQKGAAKPQRAIVEGTIPDLFFGLPKPEPASTPKPVDTNYYIWGENSDSPRVEDGDFKPRKQPVTDFVAKQATPNEIVSRAAALDGVVGALIALPEGLLVSGQMPPEFNGDTLAAFLPQIFSRVSQVTKELRQGELNNLNFTVGNVPWKIFRVNALFFAAFGRAGAPLPSSDLTRLATELDRRR